MSEKRKRKNPFNVLEQPLFHLGEQPVEEKKKPKKKKLVVEMYREEE